MIRSFVLGIRRAMDWSGFHSVVKWFMTCRLMPNGKISRLSRLVYLCVSASAACIHRRAIFMNCITLI